MGVCKRAAPHREVQMVARPRASPKLSGLDLPKAAQGLEGEESAGGGSSTVLRWACEWSNTLCNWTGASDWMACRPTGVCRAGAAGARCPTRGLRSCAEACLLDRREDRGPPGPLLPPLPPQSPLRPVPPAAPVPAVCTHACKVYFRLVKMRFFVCGPIDADSAGRGQYDLQSAKRDTWGVLCAALSIVRYVLRVRAWEARLAACPPETAVADAELNDEVRALLAAALLVAQKAKTEQQWAEGAQAAAVTYATCARRAHVVEVSPDTMTEAMWTSEVRLLVATPLHALLEHNPHSATEAALARLVERGLLSKHAATGALDRFFPLYWASIDALEADGVDTLRCAWLGEAYVCALLPALARHTDARAWRLGARILRIIEAAPPLDERGAGLCMVEDDAPSEPSKPSKPAGTVPVAHPVVNGVPVVRVTLVEPPPVFELGWALA
jgi:hypothetical protein